jgi:pilus assembly protein CpaB
MQSRMPILVAVAAAAVAVVLMNLYIGNLRASFEPEKRVVVVASRDLRGGALLSAEDISAAAKVRDSLPKFAIEWAARGNYVGQRLGADVAEGDYVMQTYFGAGAMTSARASEKIDPRSNDRLVTIQVTNETSLEGAIRPGDRIDLLLTYQSLPEGQSPGKGNVSPVTVTVPLIDDLYVVYTGPFGSNPRSGYSSITVLVSPDQAKLLVWGQTFGKVATLLRNPKNLQAGERTYISGDTNTLQGLAPQRLQLGQIAGQTAPSGETAK